ncbi:uncharacterized protein PGTG_09134 [Puccinia graminis f. sp. tritici CRL 75-36-700-3]|uniref:Uncharacterized protein n=1 Tax=Puccinia graminis f. sp. tritici (strain CRL 75-36-700-3 / race SCCL) TaxID=418459 RepID=E3KG86_PUCGT|nr:uncharacterized protein PGTG_09134 [Puccinia graminis f. sp. tritici CRL 75-36-700-3]EFP83181.2 hypothetical protein PGTG_09134 [Puccinia graminis f. sp. tritici CRL 75-36-700-3]
MPPKRTTSIKPFKKTTMTAGDRSSSPPDISRPARSSPAWLGTEWLHAQLKTGPPTDPAPQQQQSIIERRLPSSVCLDISEFRRLLQRYRKSDDSITLALNRSFLLLGSPSDHPPHQHNQSQPSTSQCAEFWKILTASWASRENLIRSCIDIVDQSVSERSRAIQELSGAPTKSEQVGRTSGAFEDDIARRHRPSTGEKKRAELEAEVYTAELKRRMIHDELAVESAIRNQALQKFSARCSPSIFPVPDTSPQVNLDPHPVPQ